MGIQIRAGGLPPHRGDRRRQRPAGVGSLQHGAAFKPCVMGIMKMNGNLDPREGRERAEKADVRLFAQGPPAIVFDGQEMPPRAFPVACHGDVII